MNEMDEPVVKPMEASNGMDEMDKPVVKPMKMRNDMQWMKYVPYSWEFKKCKNYTSQDLKTLQVVSERLTRLPTGPATHESAYITMSQAPRT